MEKEKVKTEKVEKETPIQKDRSLLYMGLVLGTVILVMGYLTLFVDDPWKIFRKDEKPVAVVEDGSLLDESGDMSDEEVRKSLTRFIEAFYYDQKKGYFDPPSYFANITETFYNYHNLTHERLKDLYWQRMADMHNFRRTWIVSTLKFERQDSKIIATYWAKESYFRRSLNEQYSGTIQYEMIIDPEGKIVSLRDIDVKNEVINKVLPDTIPADIAMPVADPAATTTADPSSDNKIYDASLVEVQPEYPGGQKELMKYISSNLKYPAAAKQSRVQGKVILAFTVEKDGQLSDVKVRQGIGSGCDEEALRLVRNSPRWKPGVVKGNPVRTYTTLPITFQLAN